MSGLQSEARNLIDIFVNERIAAIEADGLLSPQCVIGALIDSKGVIVAQTGSGGRDSAMINAVARMKSTHRKAAEAAAYLQLIKPEYSRALVIGAYMSRRANEEQIAASLELSLGAYKNAKARGLKKMVELLRAVKIIDRARGL